MTRPLLLDLFCGAGGAAAGYARAGFDVVGVDIIQQPNYPFEFHQADAITILRAMDYYPNFNGECWRPATYAAIHASPPCQDHSALNVASIDHGTGWLLAATRGYLEKLGLPWIVENVEGSGLAEQPDLLGANGLLLCGAMFGLPLYRHRMFEASFPLSSPSHPRHDVPASKAGHWKPGTYISVAGNCAPIAKAREAMGIDWTTRDELAEAIPPAFTEYIGRQLLDHLRDAGMKAAVRRPEDWDSGLIARELEEIT